MKAKSVVTLVLLAFVAISIVYLVVQEASPPGDPGATVSQPTSGGGASTGVADAKVVVYYFHGNKRCNTCRTIEAYTAEAVSEGFPEQIDSGRVEWRPVNLDEPGNGHFVDDYELTIKTVVVARFVDGREVKWTKLDRVWDLTGDKAAFVAYIKDNTNTFLAERDG